MRVCFDDGKLTLTRTPECDRRFLRGLRLDSDGGTWRAPAHCYRRVLSGLGRRGLRVHDEIARGWQPVRELAPIALEHAEHAALLAWGLADRRGTVLCADPALGQRIALGACATRDRPALVLVSSPARLAAWQEALAAVNPGAIAGLGPADQDDAPITLATVEHAARALRRHGARFEFVVVDEVERIDTEPYRTALAACAAPHRLGLGVMAPATNAVLRAAELVGPPVSRLDSLAGGVARVVLRIGLDLEERRRYRALAAWHDEDAREERRELRYWNKPTSCVVSELIRRHEGERVLIVTPDEGVALAVAREHSVTPLTVGLSPRAKTRAVSMFREARMGGLAVAEPALPTCDLPLADVAIVLAGPSSDRAACARAQAHLRGARVYQLSTRGVSR